MFYVKKILDPNQGPIWAVYRPSGQMRSCWNSERNARAEAAALNSRMNR